MQRTGQWPRIAADPSVVGARAALRRAIGAAGARRYETARAALAEAIDLAPDEPLVLAVSGLVAYVTHDYHDALERLRRAGEVAGDARVEWWVRERAERLGWDLDARRALERGAEREPEDARWPAALLALYARHHAVDAAIRAGERALELAPDAATLMVELAGMHAERGERATVERYLERALALSDRIPLQLECARLLRVVGAFDAARARYAAVLEREPDEVNALVSLAELALWSADHAGATRFAERAAASADSAAAMRILGVVAHLEGRDDEAARRFGSALAIDAKEPEVHAWLAEIAIRHGRFDEVHSLVSAAVEAASGASFAGHLLRLRIKAHVGHEFVFPDRHFAEHLLGSLRVVCPELAEALVRNDRLGSIPLLDRALARMHGNRGVLPTWLDGGTLRLVPDLRDPRRESRRVLNRIRVEDPDALVREFDALVADFPCSGLPFAHRGELLLWLGRVAEARASLISAIDVVPGTRWAYIGLSAVELLSGEPERAIAQLDEGIAEMRGTSGPAVFVHRGEALYRLGRFAEAEAELSRAAGLHADRVAAFVLLALVRIARDDEAGARDALRAVVRRAPGLVADAARELAIPLVDDGPSPPSIDVVRRVLEHALRMSQGNRSSSCVSYVTRDGDLRFGTRGGPDPHHRDAEDLAAASRLLEVGLAALPRPGRATSARRPAR